MKSIHIFGLPLTVVLVIGCLRQYEAINATSNKWSASNTVFTDPPTLTYKIVQLVVPRQIKMNDINDYHEIVLPAYSNTNIQLRNMSLNGKDVGFALIQMNAYEYSVTLSYTNNIISDRSLTGLNVGLILYEDGSLYAINTNPNEEIWVSLVLMLYNKTAPVPGGCNMEFPVEVSPVMKVTLKESTIEVDTPPASLAKPLLTPDNQCGKAKLNYESYYLSMPSYDFSQRTYFTYIRKLISYASAKASGRINDLMSNAPTIKRVYDRQKGRGMVFVTVAIDPVHQGFAAYVPVHSYACQPFLHVDECYEFNIPVRIIGFIITIIMAAEIVVGFFPIFFKAFICGVVVGLIGTVKILKAINMDVSDNTLISLLVVGSIGCAILFVIISIVCPIAAVIVCNFLVAFMMCNVIYYGIYGNFYSHPFISVVFLVCTLAVGIFLSSIQLFLFANAFLFSAMALFYGVNVIFSARLHYSMKNWFRGISADTYDSVLSDSTMDTNEIMAVASFGIILTLCVYLRMRCKLREDQVVRSGFRLPWGDRGSRTSLVFLADDSMAYENLSDHPTITRWTSGDDDVFESPQSNLRFFQRFRRLRRQ
ncbi:transmembrane 7 superfamily member 3-like [Topomyia yanbarensis]|uniref:transmembrane 7 superfamily member 3-like n=1 Tax=Topomyia yanbarensis TaxID=2498891 RepID=UPI00273C686C|nr:transmembrane 7 superfamily member 3-like [Topomyia yanbarensis]